MAEFEKMLRVLTAEQLQKAAGELLARLYPQTAAAGVSGNITARPEDVASGAEAAKRAAEFLEGEYSKTPKPMQEPETRRRHRIAESGYEQEAGFKADSFDGGSAATGQYQSMDRIWAGTEEPVSIGARELSEFFRRDSRRYDREFQRY